MIAVQATALEAGESKDDFGRQLRDARFGSLPCPERAEGGVAVELVKCANLIRAVHCSGAGAFRREVGMVQDVEVFDAELQLYAFRKREIFGELHIPVHCLREAQNVFADIPEGSEYDRIIGSAHFCWFKCGGRKPAHTFRRDSGAGSRAIGADVCLAWICRGPLAGTQGSAVVANPRSRKLSALQHSNGPTAGGGDNATQLIVSEEMVNQAASTLETRRLPNVGAGENVRVVKARWSVVDAMSAGIIERPGRIAGVKTGDTFSERQIIKTLRICVVCENPEAM
jgi:hypothetical protein